MDGWLCCTNELMGGEPMGAVRMGAGRAAGARSFAELTEAERTGAVRAGASSTPTHSHFWFDPRFAIGLVLVVVSLVGVWLLVSGAERSIGVYAARAPLAVGDQVDASDFALTPVRFEDADNLYLTPDAFPVEGLLITRSIAAGELIPTAAVGTRAGGSVTSVVIEIDGKLAASIGPGAVVDIWSAREGDSGEYGPPSVLVAEASVVRLVEATGIIAGGSGQEIEVLVPKDKVAAVLEAVANSDSLALVPVNLSIGR